MDFLAQMAVISEPWTNALSDKVGNVAEKENENNTGIESADEEFHLERNRAWGTKYWTQLSVILLEMQVQIARDVKYRQYPEGLLFVKRLWMTC